MSKGAAGLGMWGGACNDRGDDPDVVVACCGDVPTRETLAAVEPARCLGTLPEVKPLFFPGGDIGSLAVHGTVNDLAMCGATPLFLSAGFVLEEGLPIADLERVVASMARASAAVGTPIVTGDTKVVDKGKGDGIFINTAGIGRIREAVTVGPGRAQPGDAVLVSGPVGDHGIAVMAARADLEFDTVLRSDSAPVSALVAALLDAVPGTHALRDPTRGGLATALCEIAVASRVGIRLEEADVPVRAEVQGGCELLGFDPLYVACEGPSTSGDAGARPGTLSATHAEAPPGGPRVSRRRGEGHFALPPLRRRCPRSEHQSRWGG
jgi:hydrogenase expression/formation protein HypE